MRGELDTRARCLRGASRVAGVDGRHLTFGEASMRSVRHPTTARLATLGGPVLFKGPLAWATGRRAIGLLGQWRIFRRWCSDGPRRTGHRASGTVVLTSRMTEEATVTNGAELQLEMERLKACVGARGYQ